ncbi:Nn.00g093690.m01.CDS01 [Neocucurbitaria sp. VM-36]
MTDRAAKRLRRLSTEYEDSDGDAWLAVPAKGSAGSTTWQTSNRTAQGQKPIEPIPRRFHHHTATRLRIPARPRPLSDTTAILPTPRACPPARSPDTNMPRLRSRAAPAPLTAPSAAPTASSTRPRRGTANQSPAAAVIQRSSPEETRQSIRLTVKSSPGKLREATSGAVPKTGVSRQNIVAGKRASRSSRVVREVDSDEDEEEDEEEDEDEAEEVDAMDVDEEEEEDDLDAEGDEDDEMDAEGEEDEDMDEDTPAPRAVVPTNKSIPVKPAISITKPQDSVEAKEMAMDASDDDELSDPDSDLDGEEDDAEGEDEDAEGDEDDEMAAQNEDEDEDMNSDEDMSRDQTPDVSKMTKRQRAIINEDSDGALMALSNEAQKKKHLTAEEHAMRRAEMARRRKNLSEKRNEEEKLDTINRLLKKQPPKRGRRVIQDITESGQEEEPEPERANPLFVRYIQNAKGSQMGIPDEWLQGPAGSLFAGSVQPPSKNPFNGRMVQEVS